MVGHVFGIAGLSIGMARIRDMKGFSLLVDTPGMNPDVNAAKYALITLGKYLFLDVDLSGLEASGDEIKKMLESFGVDKKYNRRKEERGAATALVYLGFDFAHELLVDSLHAIGGWT